jgi:hypothetical protein
MDRRHFLGLTGTGLSTIVIPGCSKDAVPCYLNDLDELYRQNPYKACLEWFTNARFGLLINYGLYSLLGRGACVQYEEMIQVAEYAKLKNWFTVKQFDQNLSSHCGLGIQTKIRR